MGNKFKFSLNNYCCALCEFMCDWPGNSIAIRYNLSLQPITATPLTQKSQSHFVPLNPLQKYTIAVRAHCYTPHVCVYVSHCTDFEADLLEGLMEKPVFCSYIKLHTFWDSIRLAQNLALHVNIKQRQKHKTLFNRFKNTDKLFRSWPRYQYLYQYSINIYTN